jgi:hypothetical protein
MASQAPMLAQRLPPFVTLVMLHPDFVSSRFALELGDTAAR